LIIVGGGALDAGAEVQAIAEALQAPVSSFRRGRGTIPTTHPLAMSFTEGHALWQNADAVLAIGTRLYWQQSNWGVDENLPIVRLDIDPEEVNRLRLGWRCRNGAACVACPITGTQPRATT
jgi:acetolactate synthase-1/2/3 large subunit